MRDPNLLDWWMLLIVFAPAVLAVIVAAIGRK